MSKAEQPVININKKNDETASKIELIKQLIFGDNIQAYDSEFELLKKDILNKKKALEDLMDEVRTDLQRSIDDVATDVNIRITELEENLDAKIEDIGSDIVDKKTLGKLLIELGEKVKTK